VDLSSGCCPPTADFIYEIRQPLLRMCSHPATGQPGPLERMSLISRRSAQCAAGLGNLAVVGSHSQRVAELHRQNWCAAAVRRFAGSGRRFTNVTQCVTPRRLDPRVGQPPFSGLLDEAIGANCAVICANWQRLESFARRRQLPGARAFRARPGQNSAWRTPGHSGLFQESVVDFPPPCSMFGQVERIHEYKRQHLDRPADVERYLRLRTVRICRAHLIFGGIGGPGTPWPSCYPLDQRHRDNFVNMRIPPWTAGCGVGVSWPQLQCQPWPEGVSSGDLSEQIFNGRQGGFRHQST